MKDAGKLDDVRRIADAVLYEGYMVIAELPELKRYLEISRM